MELYSYQKEALEKLKNGSILCGDVGSGKSITAVAYYFCKECGGSIEPNYIPMPNPKDLYIITTALKRDKFEWDRELAPFLLSSQKQSEQYPNQKIIVDSWNNIKKYTEINNAFFIFDEQRLVGYGAWVKAFFKIAKNNNWILLTATPADQWSDYIPVFIANGFYKNKTEFLRRHAVYNRYSKYPKIERYIEQGRLIKCRNEILVRMKDDRPKKANTYTIPVEYDENEYKIAFRKRWNPFKNKPAENISELCYVLRRITNSHESRAEAIQDIQKLHDKLIIFYSFDYELEILRSIKYSEGTIIAEWNGHKHELIPNSSRWVYLVQYASGSEGWNCIETDTIIFYSQSYSYRTTTQAAGRIDRINSPFNKLYYYYLRSNSPIDRGITIALKQKRNFNENSILLDSSRKKNNGYNEEGK